MSVQTNSIPIYVYIDIIFACYGAFEFRCDPSSGDHLSINVRKSVLSFDQTSMTSLDGSVSLINVRQSLIHISRVMGAQSTSTHATSLRQQRLRGADPENWLYERYSHRSKYHEKKQLCGHRETVQKCRSMKKPKRRTIFDNRLHRHENNNRLKQIAREIGIAWAAIARVPKTGYPSFSPSLQFQRFRGRRHSRRTSVRPARVRSPPIWESEQTRWTTSHSPDERGKRKKLTGIPRFFMSFAKFQLYETPTTTEIIETLNNLNCSYRSPYTKKKRNKK